MNAYRERGCERNAFPPIVASGPNSLVVHYWQNRRRLASGQLVLIDAGAECAGCAADITRTVPVDGKFTPQQREIYEIVRCAQKAAIAAVRPGIAMYGPQRSLLRIATDYMILTGRTAMDRRLGSTHQAA